MTDVPPPDEAALLALAELRERLRSIENDRETQLASGKNDADASLAAAIFAVEAVSRFCGSQSIETRPINRLWLELAAVAGGTCQSDMLASRRARARPPDHPMIEELKGHLTAVVEHLQKRGFTRRKAKAWTVRNLPGPIAKALKHPAPKALDDWLVRWGGNHADAGRGRSGYLIMKEALFAENPSVSALPAWIRALDRYLPPTKESG